LIPRDCLWAFPDVQYADSHIEFGPGDNLVLYSTALQRRRILQAMNTRKNGCSFVAGLRERDASAITEGVLRDVARFRETRAQQDDDSAHCSPALLMRAIRSHSRVAPE